MTMGSGESSSPIIRVRVFVDFWNFQLQIRDLNLGFQLDWAKLGAWLTKRAVEKISPAGEQRGIYEAMHVYMSHDPRKATDGKLVNWATNTLDRFPGVKVVMKERRAKDPPKCPACHGSIENCPLCTAAMEGSVEKGIDTAIVTDVIRLAWEGALDAAVLVSSDGDFVPAVEFLETRKIKVVNAAFPPRGMVLSRKCWATFDVKDRINEIARS